jgi:hypothetical protein
MRLNKFILNKRKGQVTSQNRVSNSNIKCISHLSNILANASHQSSLVIDLLLLRASTTAKLVALVPPE